MNPMILCYSLFLLTACGNSDVLPNAPEEENKLAALAHITKNAIGARHVAATPLRKNALFASPSAKGENCTQKSPCSLEVSLNKLQAGDLLVLRGGTYHLKQSLTIPISGTQKSPIMIEAYPDEKVILDGDIDNDTIKKGGEFLRNGIQIQGKKYITIKNLEIQNMGARGINILYSSHVMIQGCIIHDNHLSGITIYDGNYDKPYKPYKYGYNLLEDNIIYNNSDAGLNTLQKQDGFTYSYEEGDNADGISVSSGKFNRVIHNTVFANADDGIDLWRSNNSYVSYNLVYDNGRGKGGNGNGIKAGGNRYFDNEEDSPNGKLATVEHNIAFKNKRIGFDINSGKKVTFAYNTSWKNGTWGFTSYDDTIVEHNIASENGKKTIVRKLHKNNSWQDDNLKIAFMSTDLNNPDFLRPLKPLGLGAYADTKKENLPKKAVLSNQAQIFVIGDSTVHNASKGEMGWGDALGDVLKYPKNLHNQARSGASSSTYKISHYRHHDWNTTKTMMQHADTSHGGYLLIQFGHNNKDKKYDIFYQDLKFYIKEARVLHLIPVLITPVSRFYRYDHSHGILPQIVRDVAKEEGVLLLDLQAKSREVFDAMPSHKAVAKKFGYDDITHFNPKAAHIVATWIKELSCQADSNLCTLFR